MQKGFCAVQIIVAAQRGAAHKSDNCGCAVQIIVAAQRGAAHESASQYMKSSSSLFFCRRGSGLLIYSSMLTSVLLRFIYAPLSFSRLLLPISP